MRTQSLLSVLMASVLHLLLCCTVWLAPALALVPSLTSPATNQTNTKASPLTNISSTLDTQAQFGDPFADLISDRLTELQRIYHPDTLELIRVMAVCPRGESEEALSFTFLGIKGWLPSHDLFTETFNTRGAPSQWDPATESPPSSAHRRPRRSLWTWTEHRPLRLTDAFSVLRSAAALQPMSRVSIFKFERPISWGPGNQPYWYFESDSGRSVIMGAHDQIVYKPTEAELQQSLQDEDEDGANGGDAVPSSVATS